MGGLDAAGVLTSSPKGDRYIGWHLNQGEDKAAKYYNAAQFQAQFYRPDVVAAYLKTRDIQLAVTDANAKRGGSARQQPVLTAADVQTFLPPQVVVIAPYPPESTVQQATMTVKAEAVSQTLPISDVEVHLNGIQIAGGAQGKSRGGPMQRQIELEVTLEPGINTLTFIAKHDKANSAPLFRRIVYAAPQKEERPDLRLLSIGISRYKDPSLHLDFARQDAIAIAKAFQTQEGRLFHKVHTQQLLDEKATRTDILRALNWLKEGTQRDYRLLFLSGHGGMDRQRNYYFFAYDHDATQDLEISNIKWTSILDRLTATPSKAILLVDTCRAAAITGDGKARSSVNFDQILKEMQSDYRGLVTLAASTGKQISREKPEWGHGAFTKAVLEGLLQGKADGYGGQPNGYIETKELGAWVIDRVKVLTDKEQDATHNQPPELPPFPLYQVK